MSDINLEKSKMKAVTYEKYGSPDVLELKEIETPIIENNQMLIKVHAASCNTVEVFFRSGIKVFFGLSRLMTGIRKPKKNVTGFDVAGEIVEIGQDITKFKVGDQVYGITGSGACAEYATGTERGVALKPTNMSFAEAVAIPNSGLTALQFLRDLGNIEKGQDVLIYGASGGIGTQAVQLAKYYGAHVTAVCSGKNKELVKSLGADKVIDYTKEDFTKNPERYNIIFDAVGKLSLSKWKVALKEDGIFLNAGSPKMSLTRFYLLVLGNKFRKKKVRTLTTQNNPDDLNFLTKLIEEGKIRAIIDKSYSFEKSAEAYHYYEKGHAAGKVVINIIDEVVDKSNQ